MPLTLTDRSLEWALVHAEKVGDTDIFPELFEFEAIRSEWAEVKNIIKSADLLDWSVRAYRRCLVPKHKFGFRVSTQLDPLDFLIFTALVHEVGVKLEAQRVPTTKAVVHSFRFDPSSDGKMFSEDWTYKTFQLQSKKACLPSDVTHVVVADVADFFPRLSTHRIDNALDRALGVGHMHAVAIKKLINHWAGTYSYGLPVGSAASRVIAETTIQDVDELLLSEGIEYLRYSDDFRIFCHSEAEAYRRLGFLANALFENHGLTLQQHKTKILSVADFKSSYLREEGEREVDSLSHRYYDLLESLGIEDPYGDLDFASLSKKQQRQIANLNLFGVLREQLKDDNSDFSLIRFVLRRLTQLGDKSGVKSIIKNIDKFVPYIRETVSYLLRLPLTEEEKNQFGKQLIRYYKDISNSISCLEYSRMYLLSLFSGDKGWNSDDKYVSIFNEAQDDFSKRKIMIAMGNNQKDFWFRSKKQSWNQWSPWLRRAFIRGASCLPRDEYKHWVRGIDGQLDPLEKIIAKWSQRNPII